MNRYLSATVLSLILMSPPLLKAERVQVINENKKPLSIKIQAEGDKLTEKLPKYKIKIPEEEYYEFYVVKAALNGKNVFSIKGDTSSFTSGGKCDNLSVDKKYKIVFKNDTVGTSCVATELRD